jgi:hypothetical protein
MIPAALFGSFSARSLPPPFGGHRFAPQVAHLIAPHFLAELLASRFPIRRLGSLSKLLLCLVSPPGFEPG